MSSGMRSEISLTFLLVREKVTGVLTLFLVHEFDEKSRYILVILVDRHE